MNDQTYKQFLENKNLSNYLGQELIRDSLLPDILGDDTHQILYWAGKHLARQYTLTSIDKLPIFFEQFGLGTLSKIKDNGQKITWMLSGELIKKRIDLIDSPDFFLEAGFISETCQITSRFDCESEIEKINKNKATVEIITYITKTPVQTDEGASYFVLDETTEIPQKEIVDEEVTKK